MAHGKTLELREIKPKRYIAARRKGGFRVCPDGTVYHDEGRGWRKVGKLSPEERAKDLIGMAA